MLGLVVFFAVVLVMSGQTTAVGRCTWQSGDLPIIAYVENCQTTPCQLPQLQEFNINIVFSAPRTVERMTTLATAFLGTLFPIPLAFNLGTNAETCNFLQNTSCPVVQGQIIAYKLRLFVESFIPVGTRLDVEFKIVDASDSSVITCVRLPISIVPAIQGHSNGTQVGK